MLGAAILSNINPAFLEYSRWIWGFLELFWSAAQWLVCSAAGERLHGLSCPPSARQMGILGTTEGQSLAQYHNLTPLVHGP